MSTRKKVKLVQEGHYVAEVDVDLIEDETGWSPYLCPEDAYKLDEVRDALRNREFKEASGLSRVYEMRPVLAQ